MTTNKQLAAKAKHMIKPSKQPKELKAQVTQEEVDQKGMRLTGQNTCM